jgi:hypothetical protein
LSRISYTRLESGWKNRVKMKLLPSHQDYYEYIDDFPGFVAHLARMASKGGGWNNVDEHFQPQALHCGMTRNILDYELKLDGKDTDCVLQALGHQVCPRLEGNQVAGPVTNTTKLTESELYNSTALCNRVYELYKVDFTRFKYSKYSCAAYGAKENKMKKKSGE